MSYWDDGRLVIHNYATGIAADGNALIIDILNQLSDWCPWNVLAADRLPEEQQLLRRLVDLMVVRTFVMRSTDRQSPVERSLNRWGAWSPAASFFHLSTKNVRFATSRAEQVEIARRAANMPPVPPSLKADPGRAVSLPAPLRTSSLASTLLERRTWRNFGAAPLRLADLATLLQLTWGVQNWLDVAGGRFALKTSPSGGARHSIEVYTFVRKVSGLPRGLYHYNPDQHTLARVGRAAPRRVSDYLPGQHWYDDASAVMLMTAVFDRVQWRYPYARAYRAILAESGHLCQTFCLVATALGLAPFCTMALADSRIERDLKIDGVSESVIYAAGVGTRPPGSDWAPLPGTRETPVLFPPTHRQKSLAPKVRRS
jgi:SagB-type dehydrogenase family enzyme